MHPALSVIVFTVASGAGYGLMFLLAIIALAGAFPGGRGFGLSAFAVALVLVTGGLLSSTLHLGHPERALRALSQWRSSWLSREGVAALAGYMVFAALVAGWALDVQPAGTNWRADGLAAIGALGTLLLSTLTVLSTAMIYASLKPIHAWHNGWVVPTYLANGLASGGAILLAHFGLFDAVELTQVVLVMTLLCGAFWIKRSYWSFIDRTRSRSTAASATGLGPVGQVRLLDAPHTETNYLMREMGFVVARKHAAKLRRYAMAFGYGVPSLCAILSLVMSGAVGSLAAILGAASALGGLLIERWLFFAEAKHTVTLYYGSSNA